MAKSGSCDHPVLGLQYAPAEGYMSEYRVFIQDARIRGISRDNRRIHARAGGHSSPAALGKDQAQDRAGVRSGDWPTAKHPHRHGLSLTRPNFPRRDQRGRRGASPYAHLLRRRRLRRPSTIAWICIALSFMALSFPRHSTTLRPRSRRAAGQEQLPACILGGRFETGPRAMATASRTLPATPPEFSSGLLIESLQFVPTEQRDACPGHLLPIPRRGGAIW